MKKAIVGFLITGGVFVTIGIIFACISFSMGMTFQDLPLISDRVGWNRWGNNWLSFNFFDEVNRNPPEEKDFRQSDIETVTVNMDTGKFVIDRSEDKDIHVEVVSYRGHYPSVERKDKTLKIKNTNRNYRETVYLYLPDDYFLDEIDLSIGAGSAVIKNLHARVVDVDVAAGELVGNEIFSDSSSWEVDAGKIEIEGLRGSDLSFQCAAGSIRAEIYGDENDYYGTLDCEIGVVRIDGDEYGGFNRQVNIGDRSASRKLKASCSVGELDIRFVGSHKNHDSREDRDE